MSIRVEASSTWTAGPQTKLFDGPYLLGAGGSVGRTYDISPDGQRFLMIKTGGGPDQTAGPSSLIVVQHWAEELKRLVPVN